MIGACERQQIASNVGGDGIDRAAVSIAMESIEPTACSEVAGPRGATQVTVVFAIDGNVTDAKLESGPIGTPRGECLLGRLRQLHVPAFKGAPTKVSRRLVLE